MSIIIQNFNLVSLTSIVMPYLIWLLFRVLVFSYSMHLTFNILKSLCTLFFIVYVIKMAKHLYLSQKNIFVWYLSEIVFLSRYEVIIFDCHLVTKSEQLVKYNRPSFYNVVNFVINISQSISQIMNDYLQYVIKLAKVLV